MKTFGVYKEDEEFIQDVSEEIFKDAVIWKREKGTIMSDYILLK
jgi:hypothetical protein